MKKLVISPQAGLGNRLRALCAGKVFGLIVGREVLHYWVKDNVRSNAAHVNHVKDIDPSYIFDLGIPLFDGQDVDVCFTEWSPNDYWYKEQSTAQSAIKCASTVTMVREEPICDVNDIINCDAETILVETSLELRIPHFDEFWPSLMTSVYKTYFPFNEKWANVYANVPSFDVGIVVRRGNFLHYHADADVSIEHVCGIARKHPGSKIIFSDDDEYASKLRSSANCPLGVEIRGASDLNRSVSQFVTLTKCKKIIATQGSSFAEQAAIFAGNPLLYL